MDELLQQDTPDIQLQESYSLTDHELNIIMKAVEKNSANGSDTINGLVLHDIFPVIKQTILHMINLSLCTGIFPGVFKTTKIAPVLKPGKDPLQPSSYRPVSNICNLGKLIEIAQLNQIRNHLNEHQLINTNQHGGLKKHSTTTCLLELVAEIEKAQEEKLKTAILAVDLSCAYDLVDHKLLLEKCHLLALGKLTLKWLNNYLSE